MDTVLPKPRKDLEFIPIQDKGRELILIRDRFALLAKGFAIAPPLYQFLYLLDAVDDFQELLLELSRQSGGHQVSQTEVTKIIQDLDQSFLLDSDHFRAARDARKVGFATQKIRPPALAGDSYPAEPGALGNQLDELLSGSLARRQPKGEVKGIEFQTLFLKHLERGADLNLIPILCGSVRGSLLKYSRRAFLDAAGSFLEILPEKSKGELLHYEMWHEQATRSAVSFAAMAFSLL